MFVFVVSFGKRHTLECIWLDEVSSDTIKHVFSMFYWTCTAEHFYQSTQGPSSIQPHQQNLSLQNIETFIFQIPCHKFFFYQKVHFLKGLRSLTCFFSVMSMAALDPLINMWSTWGLTQSMRGYISGFNSQNWWISIESFGESDLWNDMLNGMEKKNNQREKSIPPPTGWNTKKNHRLKHTGWGYIEIFVKWVKAHPKNMILGCA